MRQEPIDPMSVCAEIRRIINDHGPAYRDFVEETGLSHPIYYALKNQNWRDFSSQTLYAAHCWAKELEASCKAKDKT